MRHTEECVCIQKCWTKNEQFKCQTNWSVEQIGKQRKKSENCDLNEIEENGGTFGPSPNNSKLKVWFFDGIVEKTRLKIYHDEWSYV